MTTPTFCKPCPGYYREILKKLGKQAEQCRMVGNNPLDDMSAQALGLERVLCHRPHRKRKNLPTDRYPQGTLADVLAWSQALPAL